MMEVWEVVSNLSPFPVTCLTPYPLTPYNAIWAATWTGFYDDKCPFTASLDLVRWCKLVKTCTSVLSQAAFPQSEGRPLTSLSIWQTVAEAQLPGVTSLICGWGLTSSINHSSTICTCRVSDREMISAWPFYLFNNARTLKLDNNCYIRTGNILIRKKIPSDFFLVFLKEVYASLYCMFSKCKSLN